MQGEDQVKRAIIQKQIQKKKWELMKILWLSHFSDSLQPEGVPVNNKSIRKSTQRFRKVMQCILSIVSYRKVDTILDERYSSCSILWLNMILTVNIVLFFDDHYAILYNTFIFIVVITFSMVQIDPCNYQHWWILNAKFLRQRIQCIINQQLKLSASVVSRLLFLLIISHCAFKLSSNKSDFQPQHF